MDWSLIALLLAQILSCSVYSIIAPFFPSEAHKKNIGSGLVGVIFSGYPIAASLSSLFFAKFISKIGRKRLLLLGCLCEGFSMLGFGTAPFFPRNSFIVITLISRFCQGLGAGAISTATFAIIACVYSEKIELVLGFVQSVTGVGFLMGPLVGSGLYALEGFSFLFFTYGTIFLIFVPIMHFMLPRDTKYAKTKDDIELKNFFRIPTVVFDGILQILSITSFSFLNPTFSDHLATYGISTAESGIMFTIPSVMYALSVFILNYIHLGRKSIMIIGLAIVGIADFHLGPWKYALLPHKLWVVIVSLAVFGFGMGLCQLPALPDMVEDSKKVLNQYTEFQVSDSLSGILASAFYLGEMIGPPLAGILTDEIGFANSEAAIGMTLLIYAIVYITFCYLHQKKNKYKANSLLIEKDIELEIKIDK
ncbi:unnamed protein product [Blepharisma stoltei]|uniref:Major facilitator superfamily (MFS) profile domain-containing protein n=1 Tax=Blepharisma stoltei TaxID=1481888 RepID=A0AAU9IQJ2_9CILI|nr:unnamed protein product [Blepharisma stoltei]